MMTLVQAEDDMKTFMLKMKEEVEELQSTVKDLAEENAELKAENSDLKKNIQMLKNVDEELKAKDDELKKDVQEIKAENSKQKEMTATSLSQLNQNMTESFSELTVKNDQLYCKAKDNEPKGMRYS